MMGFRFMFVVTEFKGTHIYFIAYNKKHAHKILTKILPHIISGEWWDDEIEILD